MGGALDEACRAWSYVGSHSNEAKQIRHIPMPFASDHLLARGISGAVRPWRPTNVGLHGRTVSERAELAYMDFDKYLRMRRSGHVWQVKAGLRPLGKTLRCNETTGLNCTRSSDEYSSDAAQIWNASEFVENLREMYSWSQEWESFSNYNGN